MVVPKRLEVAESKTMESNVIAVDDDADVAMVIAVEEECLSRSIVVD